MGVTHEELQRLRNQILIDHGADVAEIASMMSYVWNLGESNPVARHANFAVLSKCIHARLDVLGIAPQRVEDAVKSMLKAQETVSILMSLPD